MPAGESAFFEEPEYSERRWERFSDPQNLARVAGIKRPNYLCSPEAVDRIFDAVPRARFIVVLREPISRAVSAYYHLVRHAQVKHRDLNSGLRSALSEYRRDEKTLLASVVQFGLYGQHLELWRERYSEDAFLIVPQSRVIRSLEDVLVASASHLGVITTPAEWQTVATQGAPENVGIYDDRALRLYRAGQRIRTRPLQGTHRRVPRSFAPSVWLGSGVARTATSIARPGARPPAVAPDVRSALTELYAEDRAKLVQLAPDGAVDWSYE